MKKTIISAIIALAILDVATDIMFINAILSNKQDNGISDADRHSLIGRRYIVKDSSYAIDKETGEQVSFLNDKEYIIVSAPYTEKVKSVCGTYEHTFVDVFSTRSERKYRVLYNEAGVVEE